jgi:CheY-like chemotaxis protein
VLEALEAVAAVPLPARCGFWAVADGVAVEVLVRDDAPLVRQQVAASLEEHGVPVRALHLTTARAALRRPLPVRCDLKEAEFGGTLAREVAVASAGARANGEGFR